MKFVESIEELRQVYGEAHDISRRKELRSLDRHARNFIANSPFVLIGSSDGRGNGDVTPKGDKPGFVAILDDTTLAIPDRPGNNRLDTLENLIVNPVVGLLFLIPGMNETLRINGTAKITFDETLRVQLAVNGKDPRSVVVVSVNAVYMHCAKAFLRSALWSPEGWPPRDTMPTLGEILKDQLSLPVSVEESDQRLDESYAKSMW